MYNIVINLKKWLEKKGFSSEDITEILDFLTLECNKSYTVGFTVSTIQSLNPFIDTYSAISILDELDEMDCWETSYNYLRELVRDCNSPEDYLKAIKDLFSTLLGNDLYKLFLNDDADFYYDFDDDYSNDSRFIQQLYTWFKTPPAFEEELLRLARNYIVDKLDDNSLDTIKKVLKNAPPQLITDNLVTQLNTYLSQSNISNIEITKLWKSLNK
jgi:predicted XRE-type DNA-binding protein